MLTKQQLRHKSWSERNKEHIVEYGKEYYLRNKQRIIAYARKWNKENEERYRENLQRWWKENKEHIRQYALIYSRSWRKENPKLLKAAWQRRYTKYRIRILKEIKQWREENKAYFTSYMDGWEKLNIEKRRSYNRKRRRILRLVQGSHSIKEWLDLRDETKGICPGCKSDVGLSKLSQDHIVPVSKGGTDYIWNIQPLCISCNSSKGAWHETKYI